MSDKKKYEFELTEEQADAIKKLLNIEATEVIDKESIEDTFPKLGDVYYAIDSDLDIEEFDWFNDEYDHKYLSIGNYFKTREEAEFELERLKVLAKMKKYAITDHIDIPHVYCIGYDIEEDELTIDCRRIMRYNDIYFESEEVAKSCMQDIGEDKIKKYYLGITYGHPIE